MAEESGEFDKTEEPIQKRLDEALKRGDVVKSQEVNTWFVIAGATLVLMAFSGPMSRDLTATMRGVIANSYNISVDGPALPRLFQKIGGEMVAAMAVPFLVLILAAIGGNVNHAAWSRRATWSVCAASSHASAARSSSVIASSSEPGGEVSAIGSPTGCQ